MSGLDLVAAIRATPATAQIPIMVVTAADPPADDGRAAGINRWIRKPVCPADLLTAVETLLAGTHTRPRPRR